MLPTIRIPDGPGYINNLPVCKNATCNLYQTLIFSNAELAKRVKELEDIDVACDAANQHVTLLQKEIETLVALVDSLQRELTEKESSIVERNRLLIALQQEMESMRRIRIGPLWFKNILDRFGLELVRRP